MDLTLPGFRHDFGSAVHPLAVGSPFFSSLPLGEHGLEWIHSPFALAHPFDDGSAVTVARGIDGADALGIDRDAWNNLIGEFATHWDQFAPDVLRPVPFIPRDPLMNGALRRARRAVGPYGRAALPQRASARAVRRHGRPLVLEPR